jgi:uncharacterized protein (TIGR03083 family)
MTNDRPEAARPKPGLLIAAGADGRELLAAAMTDWARPVPHCPQWDAAELVRHMGGILGWMARIVTTGQQVSRRDRETGPADLDSLPAWYSAHLERTLAILADSPPDQPTWTFSSRGDLRAGWWQRRLAVEVAIHRWDAQHACGGEGAAAPVSGEVAAAGVGEFLTEFLAGLLSGPAGDGLTGSLHLHATDAVGEWWIDLDERGSAVASRQHAEADTTVRGSRSDLLLWLTNRDPSAAIEIAGRTVVAERWQQVQR